jgi:PHD/YefM family antitoxin component YafN of YafNO toxin-antitoxin module
MMKVHTEYMTDENGKRKAIVLPLSEWQRIIEAIEELEDIRAYDRAKARGSKPIAFESAVREIRSRKYR